MTDCNSCASLCCIAPKIFAPSHQQGKVSGDLVKGVNTRCEHLLEDGRCSIHGSRSHKYTACVYYDCKGFGPPLSEYLLSKNLLNPDGTLTTEAFDLFCLFNQMMVRTFHGSNDVELRDALYFYDRKNEWPDWIFSQEYRDFIYSNNPNAVNPRRNKAVPEKIQIKKSGEKQGIRTFLKELLRRN